MESSLDVSRYARMYAVMLLCVLPSVFFSDDSVLSIKEFVSIWLVKAPMFFVILIYIRKRSLLLGMLTAFFYCIALDSAFAFGQLLTGFHLEDGRAGGAWNGSVMGMAMVLAAVFPVAAVCLWDARMPCYVRTAAGISFIMVLFGSIANQSRGLWLFGGVTGMIASLRYAFKSRYVPIVLSAVLLTGTVFFTHNESYMSRLTSVMNTTTNGSNLGRLYAWESTVSMIRDNPVVGVGPGRWRTEYRSSYRMEEEHQDVIHAHNNILHIAAESGFVGLVGFFTFTGYLILRSGRGWMADKNPYDLSVVLAAVSYLYLFGSIDYTWNNSSGIRMFFFLTAVLLALKESEGNFDCVPEST